VFVVHIQERPLQLFDIYPPCLKGSYQQNGAILKKKDRRYHPWPDISLQRLHHQSIIPLVTNPIANLHAQTLRTGVVRLTHFLYLHVPAEPTTLFALPQPSIPNA
jgi:hypothetical protein